MDSKRLNRIQENLPNFINTTLEKLFVQEKFSDLLEFCEQIIQEYPNSVIIWNNMGVAYRHMQKFGDASRAFRRVLSLNPTFSDAHANLGATFQDISEYSIAIECYRTALCLDSNNANAHYNMGLAVKALGRYGDAIVHFNRAIALRTDFVEAYCNLADAYRCKGYSHKAKESYKTALSIQPDNVFAKHMLDAFEGKNSKSPPRQFVEQLFDQYAPTFEFELVQKLKYKLPATFAKLITNRSGGKILNSILDMGCGTGLFGSEIRNFCQRLEGVDISKRMLQIAQQKNIYDRLTHQNLISFLSDTKLDFDFFIAADVFEYVGELTDVFNLINQKTHGKNTLVFSTEHKNTEGYRLEKTGRYSHSKNYIENLCQEFGYTLCHFEIIKLRKEMHSFLEGGVYILEKKII